MFKWLFFVGAFTFGVTVAAIGDMAGIGHFPGLDFLPHTAPLAVQTDPIGDLIDRVAEPARKQTACIGEDERVTAEQVLRWPAIGMAYRKAVETEVDVAFDGESVCRALQSMISPSSYKSAADGDPLLEAILEISRARNQDFLAVLTATVQVAVEKWRVAKK